MAESVNVLGQPALSCSRPLFLGLPFPVFITALLLLWLLWLRWRWLFSRCLGVGGGERGVEELLGVSGLRAGQLDDPSPPHPFQQDLHVGLAVQAVDAGILF